MRTCSFCKKPLPVGNRLTQLYCREEEGTPRCRDLARRDRLKARAEPTLDLKSLHRRAPSDTAGFRIRLEHAGRLWVGPRPGQRDHADSSGKRHSGDFYLLSELPRVPLTAEYHIDYVDKHGHILFEIENAPRVQLVRTGGSARYQPSPGLRAKQRFVDAGLPVPPQRRRICDLARDLGMVSKELLSQLAGMGFRYTHRLNSLEPDVVQEILRRFAERTLPPATHARAPLLAKMEDAPQVAPMPEPVTDPEVGELLPIPPLVQPEHGQAHAEARLAALSAEAVERRTLMESERIAAEVHAIGHAVDVGAGLVPAREHSRAR